MTFLSSYKWHETIVNDIMNDIMIGNVKQIIVNDSFAISQSVYLL